MSQVENRRGWKHWRGTLAKTAVAMAVAAAGTAGLAESVEIKPNFSVGDSYSQRMEMDQTIQQTVMGNPMTIEMGMNFEMTTTVDAQPDDGVYSLTVTYDRVEAEVNGPMGPGSWKTGDPSPRNPMLVGFAAMDGKKLTYDYHTSGDVTNLEGTEAIIEGALGGTPEAMRPQMREMFESQLGTEQMSEMIKAGHGMYPDKAVEVGETWQQAMDIGGMVPMSVDSTYTLDGVAGNEATASVQGTLDTLDDAMMPIAPGMEAEMQMHGTQEGTVVFALDTGWVQSMNLTQDIEGELTVPNPGNPGGPPMVIPMQMDSTISLEMME
ncbi:MAG: DUF6263 family protein [Planctomycetota bacterium]